MPRSCMPAAHRAPPHRPHCFCFRLCSEIDARSFHLRLPTVSSLDSPWAAYLQWVYGDTSLPLPIDLQQFEIFYLALLPVEWRCNSSINAADNRIAPPCSADECSSWLLPQPVANQLALHAQHWDLRSFQWHRTRLPTLLLNHTLRLIPRRPSAFAFQDFGRVEVTRRSV